MSTPAFSIAHLATHGEFSADHRKSFILTYDNRLTMDALRTSLERRGSALDLLVLSACKTAAGETALPSGSRVSQCRRVPGVRWPRSGTSATRPPLI